MNPILIAIENREKGQVPISIGTSLALEAGFGVYPDRPEKPAPFTRVKQLWINLRTIVRNLYACLPTDLKDTVLPDDLWRAALEELSIIESTLAKQAPQVKAVFYVSDYVRLKQRFPHASIKEPITPKQIVQQKVEDVTLRLMLENNHQHNVSFFDFDIQGQFPASFILTHLPIDLLARYRFDRLELLESHTGKIKGASAWHTKLTNGKELENVPFNSFTLQLFGDKGNMFSPQSISVRRSMLEAARQGNWTNVSTMEKIRDTVSKVPNQAHRDELMKLL
jgi:hypothetical protein